MKLIRTLTVLCAMLTGCVSTGVDIRPEQLSNFLLGFSTIDDVTSQLGTP